MITWDDFKKVDMRVGSVVSAEDFPEAKKQAYKLTIDFGPFGIKKTSAQITNLYKKEDLVNKQIIAVVNFPTKQIANFVSEVLVLCVVGKENEVILLEPDKKADNGLKIA